MNYQLTTQPYKGTKDYYPKDMFKRNYIFEIWKETALEFGYEEYDNPILEDANIYRAKSGDELANTQLYNFLDKGGREVAIKPEMTPSLARMIAAKINELPKPIRWFNISKYYRYEKPQRGRTREFFQLNIDILGIETVEAEVEIFQYIDAVMRKFKASFDIWKIYINNRKLVDYIYEKELQLTEELKPLVSKAIDNYTKVTKEEYPEYLKEIGLKKEQIEKLLEFLSADIDKLKEYAKESEGAKDLLNIISRCEDLGVTNIEFKPYIMRGLAYYTGTVIELFDTGGSSNPRALFGGGRYDDLLTIFDKDKIPAFGLGWGNITMEDFLETYNLFPEYKSTTQTFVCLLSKENIKEASRVTKLLRDSGIRAEQQLKDVNLGKQIDYANKKGIKYVVFVGDKLEIKNLETGSQRGVTLLELVDTIKAM